MIRFKLIILMTLAVILNSSGQSTSPQVIGSSGNSFSGPNASFCWTLGEIVTETISDGGGVLTQGFQQPCLKPPVAVCQNVTVELNTSGSGQVLGTDLNNGSTDDCGELNFSVSTTSTTFDPANIDCEDAGANSVTLTVSDNSGNESTCSATVHVQDNIDPTANCKDITVDLVSSLATITGPDVDDNSTDNCDISGAPSVSPNMFNCNNIGGNTVTLTVTDDAANESTCTSTVTVNGVQPAVSISESTLPAFCQGKYIILSAVTSDDVTYYWSPGGQTTASIEVSAIGTYSVTVTSTSSGCTESANVIINDFDPGSLLSAYTILAVDQIHFHDDVIVETGGVGIKSTNASANNDRIKLHDYSFVDDFSQSVEFDIDNTSDGGTLVNASASAPLPQFKYNWVSDNSSADVKVNKDQNVILDGCIYDKVEIKERSTVTFTCQNLYIKELKTKDDVTIKFGTRDMSDPLYPASPYIAHSANIFVQDKVEIGKFNTFNALDALGNTGQVISYIEKDLKVKEGTFYNGSVYAINDIKVHADAAADERTNMNGVFIAKKVEGKENVRWNWGTVCDPPPFEPVPFACRDCKGGITFMNISYQGAVSPANVVITDKDGIDIYWSGIMEQGDTASFYGSALDNKLDKDTRIWVNGDLNTTIHTSCSKPIGEGAIWGEFVVTYAESKDNGPVCPEPAALGCDNCSGGVNYLTLRYDGTSLALITVTNDAGTVNYFGPTLVGGGASFSFEGDGTDNKMDHNTRVLINAVEDVTILTSCDDPIGRGSTWGSFTVLHAESVNNGDVCPAGTGTQARVSEIEHSAYPNPFMDKSTIEFILPEAGRTTVEIVSLTGEVIKSRDFGSLDAAVKYTFEFAPNGLLSGGTYFYRIISGNNMATEKLILLK